MPLEPKIAERVNEFIAAGRPSSRDPLRDEGEALYSQLVEQGVPCTCQRYLGVIHGFFQLGGISQAARDAMRDIAWRVSQ